MRNLPRRTGKPRFVARPGYEKIAGNVNNRDLLRRIGKIEIPHDVAERKNIFRIFNTGISSYEYFGGRDRFLTRHICQ